MAANEQGAFQLTGLLPGEYELTVKARGFAVLTGTVNVEVGRQLTLDVNLKITGVSTTVEVKGEAAVLCTAGASVGEVVEQKSVRSLPLNGRMLIDLVLTVPGAHLSHGARAGDMSPLYWRPGQRSAVSVGWNHIVNPNVLNMAAVTISRLSMHRSSENSASNDIVSELGGDVPT